MGILVTRLSVQFSLAAVLFALVVPASAEQPPVLPLITQRVDETKRTVLQGNTHPLARPQYDRGAAPPNLPMNRMLLVLKRSPAQESALLSLLDDQQDKASANYHKWLTPENFGKQFGPADQDIQTVTKWLQSHGFQIGNVAKGKNIIEFSGVASQVQETFHTAIHRYVVNGEEHWANANDPEIPTALTPVIAGVHTMHNFLKKPMIHIAEKKIQAQLVKGKDGKTYVTFPGNPPLHALGPPDFETIYNINPVFSEGNYGGDAVVAVVARSNVYQSGQDIARFNGIFLGDFPATRNIVLNGPDPGDLGGGEEIEATLDFSWAAAVAPYATADLVVSASTNTTDGTDLSELYIIDNNFAHIMTESFGTCEADATQTQVTGIETLAEQAAAQGITYLVSAGDTGAEGCDDVNSETIATGPISVNVLASSPFTVAVGGTLFNEDGQDSKYWSSTDNEIDEESALSYIPEDAWNESCTEAQCGADANIAAGGGGASTFFSKPSWQAGVTGIPSDNARDLPDVSFSAAGHDPYLICLENSCAPDDNGNFFFLGVSGTSASTPSFAGVMALIIFKQNNLGVGQPNYVLYKLAATEKLSTCNGSQTSGLPASNCIFNDVTTGNNAVPGEEGYGQPSAKYQTGTGYDLATGLGSLNVANMVSRWSTVTFTPTTTTLSLNPTTFTHGQTVNVNITVTPKSGTGTPTGNVALLNGNTYQGLGSFTLSAGSVSSTISSLPGGSGGVIARYSGDSTFATSSSNAVPITVAPEGSITRLTSQTLSSNFQFIPFSGGPYGSFIYLRADVAGQSGNGTPTGVVNITDTAGSLPGNPFALNGQGNTETPNFLNSPNGSAPTGLFTLIPGAHSIAGKYSGDPSFGASTSVPVNFTITQAPTTNTLTVAGATKGATLTATINTSSGGTPPSGTIQFFVNGSAVGSPIAVTRVSALTTLTGALQGAQATATYKDTALANGTPYTVTAAYKGDTNYLPSTSSTVPITLQSDFSFTANENTVNIAAPGSPGSLTLSVKALDGYSGTIKFDSSACSGLPAGASCSFGSSSITGSGGTTLTITTTEATTGMLRPGPTHGLGLWAAFSGTGLAAWFWLSVPAKRRRSFNLLAVLFCTLLITGVGCGGGSSGTSTPTPPAPPPSTPTPAGTYTVVVTAASGSLKHSVSFTLNVQ
ncbi:MAG TPA: Ig-like domain repeat protein [Terriglobales bacterium]|jgi:hypothetical protein|nr:Ig-like domain repeat protein [Terriglobales bacterium]